jgi:hypothetical protein
MTDLAVPVSKFLTVTAAPAMAAPDGSCTIPDIVPVVTWAETRCPLRITLINSTGKNRDMLLSSFKNQPIPHL